MIMSGLIKSLMLKGVHMQPFIQSYSNLPPHVDSGSSYLKDGTPVFIRLLTPEDKNCLQDGYERLSERTRYARFFRYQTTLSKQQLAYFTEMDNVDHLAFGVLDLIMGPQFGVAIGRYIKVSDEPKTAEVAITVADAYQGKGLGQILLQKLTTAALENGFEKFVGYTMPGNKAALHMLHPHHPKITIQEGPVLRLVWDLV